MPRAGRLLLILLALVAPAAATPVRMFAVGHKLRVDDGVTYQSFHDKMAALMDAGFPGRASLVQAGVDDVASHLFPADAAAPATALVVFPKDVGLVAALTCSRPTAPSTIATTPGIPDNPPSGRSSSPSPTRSTAASTRPSASSR